MKSALFTYVALASTFCTNCEIFSMNMYKEAFQECTQELNITASVDVARWTQLPDQQDAEEHPSYACLDKCLYEKLGIIQDEVLNVTGFPQNVRENITQCYEATKNVEICERSRKLKVCIFEAIDGTERRIASECRAEIEEQLKMAGTEEKLVCFTRCMLIKRGLIDEEDNVNIGENLASYGLEKAAVEKCKTENQ